jgi:hypothetical protein
MSKMALHEPFRHLKHKLCAKEGPGVKLAIWLPTTKSQESTRFPCVQATCDILLKSSRRGLQLCFRPHRDRRFAQEVMCLQSCESPSHLDVAPVEWCKIYYMGEGGGFPRVRAVMSLVSPKMPVAHPSTKGAPEIELTNLWLVGCRSE